MKVGKREFKAAAERYLRLAEGGETVVITEAGEPILELRSVKAETRRPKSPPRKRRPLKLGVSSPLPRGTVDRWIDEERSER